MPSRNHCDEHVRNSCDNDQQINHGNFLFSDKSLTDLLSSENVRDISINSANENNPLPESNEELILRLEAIQFQAEQNERIALHNQVELLMGEIASLKKTDRTQKNELKKSINENDKLRKDISRFSGTRKHAERKIDTAISTRCASSTQTDYNESHDKYTALKSKLVSITDFLLTALDDCDDTGFTTVSRGKQATSSEGPSNHSDVPAKLQPHRPVPTPRSRPRHSESQQQVLPQRHTAVSLQQTLRQSIPVVEIGAAARNAAKTKGRKTMAVPSSPSSAPAAGCNNHVIVIGSSLVSGLGTKLHSMGINATTFMYRGADIPTIQSRVPHILKPGMNPKYIVLQVAGNDATKQDSKIILAHYETLIRDIRGRCPSATIVPCKVPPRRGTVKTMSTINDINAHLNVFVDRLQNVLSVDVCPESVHHFRKDCTHFNRHGVAHYAQKLAGVLRNFHQVYTTVCM